VRILITAGPTREYLDDVRYLSNASTGKMGYALVRSARLRGHDVVLVSGPVDLPAPEGCEVLRVVSSREMHAACLSRFPQCDGVIGAAAVCDYRPRARLPGKIKKTGKGLQLDLVETEDILATLGRIKEHRWIVGFALESEDARPNALRKLESKHCDAIVLNHPRAIGADDSSIELIDRSGETAGAWTAEKAVLADHLLAWIESTLGGD
jgi:phosphopantothenoylcysteine decarboxylase / phosphopantothenate---cysteine ligase